MVPLPPLLPASLAAWLEQEAGARTQQWDSTFRVGPESFEIAVSRLAPLCIWLFTHPTTRDAAHLMIRAARASGAVVIVGGPDAGLRGESYLRAGAHAAVIGEGEASLLPLFVGLRGHQFRPDKGLFARTPGVVFLDSEGKFCQSVAKAQPIDMDALPRPLRDAVDTRIHTQRWSDLGRGAALSLSSSRGCPVVCGFCTNSVFGRPYRRRRPDEVVSEMEDLVYAYDLDRLLFDDETFLFDPLWLKEFGTSLRERGLRIPFEASAHPAYLDATVLPLLREVGLDYVDLQATSGSSPLLRRLGWSHTPADVYRAAGYLKDAGIDVGLQIFVGLPGETRDDLDASMEMVRAIGPSGVEVTRVDPGSPALFRKDWERVVGGSVVSGFETQGHLASPVLDAAVAWMHSFGGSSPGQPEDLLRSAVGRLGRPLLRAFVKAPWRNA